MKYKASLPSGVTKKGASAIGENLSSPQPQPSTRCSENCAESSIRGMPCLATSCPERRLSSSFFFLFSNGLGGKTTGPGFHAARSWAESYVATNQLIGAINERLQRRVEASGYRAATTPATHNFDEQKLVSRWSHKHLAYIAGLGKFGRHHQLITASGCCGRLGSLITSMPLTFDPRPAEEWCLEKAGIECSACVSKCSYEALLETGYDRRRCYEQCLINDRFFSDLPLVDVCGKCGCEVPCSYGIPTTGARK